jgi:selenide,water dikinase
MAPDGPACRVVKDVVLVGAGHAHVAVLRRFGLRSPPGARLTLIARELHTPYSGRDRPPVLYDLLSLDIGATPDTLAVPGAAEHAIPVKPISAFLPLLDALIARVRERRGRARLALVGAGAGGVELLLALEGRLRREIAQAGHDPGGLAVTLVSGSDDILPTFPRAFRRRFERLFAARGIALVTGARVTRVEAGVLHCEKHAPIPADEILWATRAGAAP